MKKEEFSKTKEELTKKYNSNQISLEEYKLQMSFLRGQYFSSKLDFPKDFLK